MSKQTGRSYQFGRFRVDAAERRLVRDGEPVLLPPKTFDTLLALVEHSGHLVQKDELMKTVWPDAFVEENNLTQHVYVLRKVLGEGNGEKYIETVPRIGYRFTADVREVWDERADLVVENRTKYRVVVKEEIYEAEQDQPVGAPAVKTEAFFPIPSPQRRLKPKYLVLVASLVLVGLVAALAWTMGKTRRGESGAGVRPEFNSIAVLPFKTIGQGDEHLGLGVADTLIARLSRVRQIGVRPISAVHRFTGLGQDPIAAGRALGVDAVLDGRVQRADGRIRVTVELISVQDGAVLWTETLDENADHIFKLQDAITARVVESLPAAPSGEERALLARRYTTNPEAYDAYLKGRFFWNKRTQEGFAKAVEHFRQAIRLDPNYALAYAGLADCYVLGADPLPLQEHTRRLKETAGRALKLDDSLAEPHAALAYYIGAVEWDWQGADRGFQRAIELNPSYATAYHWYAYHLAGMGRLEEAIAAIRRAQELDPLSLIINTDVGHILYFAGRFDEAIAQYRLVLDMDAHFAVAHWRLSEVYIAKGMYQEAVAEFEEAKRLGVSNAVGWIGYAHAVMGQRAEAQKELAELKRLTESLGSGYMYRIAIIHTALGNHEQALAWLERTYEARDSGEMALIKVDPTLTRLRSHPRFERLLRRMKLAA